MAMAAIDGIGDRIAALCARRRFGMRPGLERMEALMEALGHPERTFAAIHVAGTNGKGSVAAITASVLQHAGLGDVGLYTSPHLVFFNERIRIAGRPVDDGVLADSLGRVEDAARSVAADADGQEPTFFECATAMAFDIFRSQGVKVAVVETGLGGRLDATNVVLPVVSAITTIGLEHCQYLGNTLREIAHEKGGIIKPSRPVVIGQSIGSEAREELLSVAAGVGAPLVDPGVRVERRGCKVSFEDDFRTVSSIPFPLAGDYQMDNLATAVAALEAFSAATGINVADEAFKAGISSVSWPCRFQIVSEEPLVIVDGAHNPPAAAAFSESLRRFAHGVPLALVAGFCSDKDAASCLKSLRPRFKVAFATETPSERTMAPEALADEMRKAGFRDVRPEADWRKAYADALDWARGNGGGVVVLGSLFLAGAVAHESNADATTCGVRIPSERLAN